MVAVKTNHQLRTKSNVSLACLATTDLVVGLVVQPLQIVHHSFMLKGEADIICGRLTKISTAITVRCVMASLNHFVVLGTERYIAIKHSFAYDNLVTEIRIAVASGLAWAVAITLPLEDFWPANIRKVARFVALAMQFIFHAFILTYLYTGRSGATKNKLLLFKFPEKLRRSYSRIRKLFTAQLLYCSQFSCVISRQLWLSY